MDIGELSSVLERTRETLRVYTEARDDDRILYERILAQFYPTAIRLIEGEIWTKATDHSIPSYDYVLRARRIVQNIQRQYLPSLDVAIARGMNADEWREAMNSLPLWSGK